MFNEQGCRNPGPRLRQPHYCAAPFSGEDCAIQLKLLYHRDNPAMAISARRRPAAAGEVAQATSSQPYSAGTSLDSFQCVTPLIL
jgi:hypothetical protein